jgi:hypothetical protein
LRMKPLRELRPQTNTLFVGAMGLRLHQVCQSRQKLTGI